MFSHKNDMNERERERETERETETDRQADRQNGEIFVTLEFLTPILPVKFSIDSLFPKFLH